MTAMSPVPGRSLLVGLLLFGSLGCAAAHRVTSTSTSPSRPRSVPSSVPGTGHTTHANVVATHRYSAWLLHAVPMPPGAREWSRSPTAHYRHASLGIGPSDPAFTRTTWWTVPLAQRAFVEWLATHAPPGLRRDVGSDGSTEAEGVVEHDVDFLAPSTPAHTGGWVNYAFTARSDTLVVRTDTFVGARFARTVLVPDNVTAVTIRRYVRSFDRPSRPRTTLRTVTGRGAVAHLVAMVNGLPGAMTTPFVAPCPAARVGRSYTMTFATPQGSYVASLPTTTCWPELALSHDGDEASPPLDPGRRFVEVADRYLRAT